MQPIVKILGGLMAENLSSIATAQTLAGAGPVTLDGTLVANGVAIIDPPACVSVASSGDNTALTFTIVGTDIYGETLTQNVAGTNASSAGPSVAYSTITSITSDGATDGNITVGNIEASQSAMISLDPWAFSSVSAQMSIINSGFNYTVQVSLDNPNDPVHPCPPQSMQWFNSTNSNFTGQLNTSRFGDLSPAPLYMRVFFDGAGSARFTITQFGSVAK